MSGWDEAERIALYACILFAVAALLGLPAMVRAVRLRRLQKMFGSLYWRLLWLLDRKGHK